MTWKAPTMISITPAKVMPPTAHPDSGPPASRAYCPSVAIGGTPFRGCGAIFRSGWVSRHHPSRVMRVDGRLNVSVLLGAAFAVEWVRNGDDDGAGDHVVHGAAAVIHQDRQEAGEQGDRGKRKGHEPE